MIGTPAETIALSCLVKTTISSDLTLRLPSLNRLPDLLADFSVRLVNFSPCSLMLAMALTLSAASMVDLIVLFVLLIAVKIKLRHNATAP